jgi:hypothetical protein
MTAKFLMFIDLGIKYSFENASIKISRFVLKTLNTIRVVKIAKAIIKHIKQAITKKII